MILATFLRSNNIPYNERMTIELKLHLYDEDLNNNCDYCVAYLKL